VVRNSSNETAWVSLNTACPLSAEHACDVGVAAHGDWTVDQSESFFYYWVPPVGSGSVTFHAQLIESGAHSPPWRVESPIARLADFVRPPLEIVNVPLSQRSRISLRVFSRPMLLQHIDVTVFETDELQADVRETATIRLASNDVRGSSFAAHDLATIFGVDPAARRIRIRVTPVGGFAPQKLWGFVSITDNLTQDVTFLRPQ
jgi:hypothetical protein